MVSQDGKMNEEREPFIYFYGILQSKWNFTASYWSDLLILEPIHGNSLHILLAGM
jgi:hypothetical protein